MKSYFVLNYIIEHFCIMLGRNKNSGIVSYLSRVWIPDTATKYLFVIKLPQSKRIMVLVLFYLLFLTGIIISAAWTTLVNSKKSQKRKRGWRSDTLLAQWFRLLPRIWETNAIKKVSSVPNMQQRFVQYVFNVQGVHLAYPYSGHTKCNI